MDETEETSVPKNSLAAPGVVLLLVMMAAATSPSQAQDNLDALFGAAIPEEQNTNSSAQPADDDNSSQTSTDENDEALGTIALEGKPPPEIKRRPTSRLVEEIVVTAQKREESLQDVPISVQAFSEEKLDALGVTDQSDLQQLVPSLNISQLLSFTTIYLRGIGTDAFLTADPSIATYIDGIYFPFAMGLTQDFGVLERIEVLKGPQGTLFGRNATGGALNIVTRDPVLGEFDAQANVTVASYPDLHTKAYVNIPLGDTMALSISPIFARTDHYIRNVNPDPRKPLGQDESTGIRAKFRWAPTDWFDATIGALDIETLGPSANLIPTTTATDLAVLLGADREQYQPGSDEANLDACCENGADNRVFYGTAKFFTPWFDSKLLGSHQFISTNTRIDLDGTPESIVGMTTNQFDSDITTAELQFISNDNSWGSDWMRWIMGAYYFDGDAGFIEPNTRLEVTLFRSLQEPIGDLLNPLLGLVDGLDLFDLLPDLEGPEGELPLVNRPFGSFRVRTKSQAAFLQSTFTFTEWLDLTLGLRYQDESRNLLKSTVGVLVAGEEVILIDRDSATRQDGTEVGPVYSEQTWSPKISLETRPFADDTLVYLNYQEATKSGTYNGLALLGPATFADPETARAWELGIKSSFLHGTLVFNGAMFNYDLEDLQVQFVSLTTGGSVAFENAERGHIRGLDFDFTWLIAPHLIDGLVLAGGLGWLETAEYTSYPDARGYTDNSGIAQNNLDFSGNRIVKTPEISGNLALAKSWFLNTGSLEVAGNMYYTDEFFNEPSNRELTVQPAYALFGAHVSYLHEPWNLRVSLFGRNLTDQYVTRGIQPADFGDLTTIGQPRTYGLRLAWQY